MNNWNRKDLDFVWHPFTQMKDCVDQPNILIEKTRGIRLYDDKGNFYYDTISSWWCNVHGHNHPAINQAINRQLKSFEHVLFAGFTHKPAIGLAQKLVALSHPKLTKVFFSDNGSTAVEVALKMSLQYRKLNGDTKRNGFICLDHGYHGDTIGSMSVSGQSVFNQHFRDLLFPAHPLPSPYCYRCPMKLNPASCGIACIRPLEKLLEQKAQRITALIIEPLVLAAGGMIVYPKEYLEKAARLCKKFGVHLILDEVATGFGRTGKMFAYEHTPTVQPDFVCLSKGITAGYLPMGATLTTEEIYRAFYADYERLKTFFHGHTFTANPLACAAALASLAIFEKERTLEKLHAKASVLHEGLERFLDLAIVGDVRRLGMIGAVELVKNRKTKEPFPLKRRLGYEIYRKGLKHNLILRPLGNIVYFYLPLSTTITEIKDILNRAY